MSNVIERIEELIERFPTRKKFLGEGRLLDTLTEIVETRRPRLINKLIKAIEEWTPGERIFGQRRKR